jgi:hypothetical protein
MSWWLWRSGARKWARGAANTSSTSPGLGTGRKASRGRATTATTGNTQMRFLEYRGGKQHTSWQSLRDSPTSSQASRNAVSTWESRGNAGVRGGGWGWGGGGTLRNSWLGNVGGEGVWGVGCGVRGVGRGVRGEGYHVPPPAIITHHVALSPRSHPPDPTCPPGRPPPRHGTTGVLTVW